MPRQRNGEPVGSHPLYARLLSLVNSDALPTIDLDREISNRSGAQSLRLNKRTHRPLPGQRRWWKLEPSQYLGPRMEESYSSEEKFIYSPYAWVFRYKAGLQPGPIASLRMRDAARQKGILLHRLLDLLLGARLRQEIRWRLDSFCSRRWNGRNLVRQQCKESAMTNAPFASRICRFFSGRAKIRVVHGDIKIRQNDNCTLMMRASTGHARETCPLHPKHLVLCQESDNIFKLSNLGFSKHKFHAPMRSQCRNYIRIK